MNECTCKLCEHGGGEAPEPKQEPKCRRCGWLRLCEACALEQQESTRQTFTAFTRLASWPYMYAPDTDPVYREQMRDAGRERLLR